MGMEREKVKEFLSRFFGKYDIGDDEDIFSLGFVNSLFAMQLVLFLEREFSITVNDQDMQLDNFRTINNIVSFIEKQI